MSGQGPITSVKILGEEYRIRGGSPGQVARLAAVVDEKLRELQASRPAMDTKRLAVMVCLNIAEELDQDRCRHDEVLRNLADTSRGLRSVLEDALRESSLPGSFPS